MTACRSITHVVNLGSHPAALWRRLSLVAYLVHVYLYLPIMTVCCMFKVMKTMTQEPQSAKICQDRSAQPLISKYVSARILMQTLNTVGSFLKSKMKEKMREDCRNFTLCIFLSKANVSTCKNRSLCVIAHMCTMKLIMYGDGLSYRWLETYGGILSYRGLHKTGAMQKPYYISRVI